MMFSHTSQERFAYLNVSESVLVGKYVLQDVSITTHKTLVTLGSKFKIVLAAANQRAETGNEARYIYPPHMYHITALVKPIRMSTSDISLHISGIIESYN